METRAVLMRAPYELSVESVGLVAPAIDDVVVEIHASGVSTGTERLLWSGDMPSFPGMGYPLVPGYESVGEVVEGGRLSSVRPGTRVFVPGGNCYDGARGLFGGAAARIVTRADRVMPVDAALGKQAVLLALAATARHAVAGLKSDLPDLIVGHGVLGRLLARIACIAGGRPPTVWEADPKRREGAFGYRVVDPEQDSTRSYQTIFDASGDPDLLNTLIGRLAKGGEIVLAGFYPRDISFAFPPAFVKEARIRVSAEWSAQDMLATKLLIEDGHLSLDGLVTHSAPAADASSAYRTAFEDPGCLKMILDWKGSA